MKSESEIMRRVQVYASRLGWRLFRNNIALGWVGRPCKHCDSMRRVRFGLCPGSSDLIGWKPVTITPEMVGSILPVFAAIEVKTESGKPTAQQKQFLLTVNAIGGYGKIVRSEADL